MAMKGMAVGGVDPSILRELSGVYKPFVKAFKELISNAYDADAENVSVVFEDDFSCVSITDDGTGMTPFDFRSDFTRIGGSSRRWSRGKTPKGRPRIGSRISGVSTLLRSNGSEVAPSKELQNVLRGYYTFVRRFEGTDWRSTVVERA